MEYNHQSDPSQQEKEIKQLIKKHPSIRLALLFGSVAKGSATSESDIDIAVMANQTIEVSDKMQLIAEIAQLTGRPVDLIDLSTVGEPLLGQIIKNGKQVLRDNVLYAQLINKHLINEADFMPYQRRILQERRRRWIGC